ncbi:hypothetical protein Bbelb_264320 [Branchiostoma belcheri]|nr:hypothetical protein Bbelb_264320 [Branchiostoma belcheri]
MDALRYHPLPKASFPPFTPQPPCPYMEESPRKSSMGDFAISLPQRTLGCSQKYNVFADCPGRDGAGRTASRGPDVRDDTADNGEMGSLREGEYRGITLVDSTSIQHLGKILAGSSERKILEGEGIPCGLIRSPSEVTERSACCQTLRLVVAPVSLHVSVTGQSPSTFRESLALFVVWFRVNFLPAGRGKSGGTPTAG